MAATAIVVAVASASTSSTSPSAPLNGWSSASAADDADHYRSTVTALTPAVEGLDVTLKGGGESITVRNATGREAMVLGYAGEPYLRFAADGVWVNTGSLTAQVNAGTPPGSGSTVAWRRVADGTSYTWRDDRVRWSAPERPPIVAQDERARHRVFPWALPMTVAERNVLVQGEVEWTGTRRFGTGEIVVGVVALAAAVALGAGAALLLMRRRRS